MSDDNNVREIPPRPPISTRPPLDGHLSSAEYDAKGVANKIQQERLIEWRTAARQDALVCLERARERVGIGRTNWSRLDADTLHAMTDLLLQVQAQEAPRA
jgi:hypothetical protein